jgi:hypothetical protein
MLSEEIAIDSHLSRCLKQWTAQPVIPSPTSKIAIKVKAVTLGGALADQRLLYKK